MSTSETSAPSPRPFGVVTGASSGIGRELARELAERGYDLVVVAEDDAIHDVAHQLTGTASVMPLQVDRAERSGNDRLVGRLDEEHRPLAVAAINAGVGVGGPLVQTPLDDHLRLVALNVGSTVHLGKQLAGRMVDAGSGRLLFTSSIASQLPGSLQTTYAASKAFVQSFAEGLGQEVADHGVTVTALMPGATDTEFFDRAGLADSRIGRGPKDDPAQVAHEGIEAMLDGRDHVVTGARRNKVMAAVSALVPDAVGARLQGRMAADPQD